MLGGALALVPACLGTARVPERTPLAGGGGPSAGSTPTVALSTQSAPGVAGISLRNWTAGHRPHSTPGEDCGVKEAFIDMNDLAWRNEPRLDRSRCFSKIGCPSREAVDWPRCESSRDGITEMDEFLSDEQRWQTGAAIRLRGRLFVNDPHHREGFGIPYYSDHLEEPHCFPNWQRKVSLQLRRGDECHRIDIRSGGPSLSCDGDLSRSCCGHLPMGEMVQATGRLRVDALGGSYWATMDLVDICAE